MAQPLTEALVEAARQAARSDAWERDQVAWNLPRELNEGETPQLPAHPDRDLDWAGFSEAFYPGSRRHDLRAIAAYAAYKRAAPDV